MSKSNNELKMQCVLNRYRIKVADISHEWYMGRTTFDEYRDEMENETMRAQQSLSLIIEQLEQEIDVLKIEVLNLSENQ